MVTKYTAPSPLRSALLTIDMQRDFTIPGSTAEVPGTAERVPAMGRVVQAYRRHGLPIVHIVRLYRPDGSNVDLCRRELLEGGASIVLPGSEGAELVAGLKPNADCRLDADALLGGNPQEFGMNEWAMYKPRWDAFFGTPLDRHLAALDVTTVAIVGCNFPNCPRATVYSASMRDYRVVLIADAVSGVYERGIEELNRIGVSTPSAEEYIAWLDRATLDNNWEARSNCKGKLKVNT
ncbi:MAG: cysteine hydrolase [Acidobacteriia bacterium]|nr:cysteine hydrolase [Terriglobia bacterium]